MTVVLSTAFCQSGPTKRPLSMALTSSSGINGASNNTNSDFNIVADLMKVYLADRKQTGTQQQQQQQPRQINGKRVGPLIEELSSAVLSLTGDYERRYKSQLENLRSNWIIDAANPKESFQQVLDNVFIDDCNWGRIVTIFVFASMFLRQCQCQGVDTVTPDDVCQWAADYVVRHNILAWIKRNGDWMGLIRFYKDGESNLAATGAAAAPAVAPDNHGNDSGVLTRLITVAGAGLAIVGLTSFLRA